MMHLKTRPKAENCQNAGGREYALRESEPEGKLWLARCWYIALEIEDALCESLSSSSRPMPPREDTAANCDGGGVMSEQAGRQAVDGGDDGVGAGAGAGESRLSSEQGIDGSETPDG